MTGGGGVGGFQWPNGPLDAGKRRRGVAGTPRRTTRDAWRWQLCAVKIIERCVCVCVGVSLAVFAYMCVGEGG